MRFIVLCMGTSLSLLSGCLKTPKEYSTHGISLVTTHSKWERECDSVAVEVHRKMANWVINDEGAKCDRTYKARSRSWKSGKDKEDALKDCSVSSLEFVDANNNTNVIETICIHDKGLLLIKCISADDQATIKLRNEVVSVLNLKDFKHVD